VCCQAVELSDVSRDEGVYEEVLFADRLKSIVTTHSAAGDAAAGAHGTDDGATAPLFLVYAARIAHYPIQAPAAYQELPHIAAIETPHRMVYHAQIEYLDDQLGNLTALYKQHGMWNNT
jgi:arylsulfatase A-like enzyme